MGKMLLLPMIVPLAGACLILAFARKNAFFAGLIMALAAFLNLAVSGMMAGKEIAFSLPWAGFGIDFSLRLYSLSALMLLVGSLTSFLVALYTWAFMKDKENASLFNAYFLVTLALASGALLADNFVLLLFFWEGILVTLFAMISSGGKNSFRTAVKALVIVGVTDICLMAGIALAGKLSGTLEISKMHISPDMAGTGAFLLLFIGALGKIGAMPFHTWIPDAAKEAPLPFMAFLPASLEKLLGVYLMVRITHDIFSVSAFSWLSTLMMVIGAATLILAVLMAIVQDNMKKFLAYDSISQAGYMVLGVGTCLPIGLIGALLHAVNNAFFKTGLFLSAGCVEKATGETDINKVSGLAKTMPFTFACFAICGLGLSGIPPFSGFFSKEMIYDAAYESNKIFYFIAAAGSFLTLIAVLRFGHAMFFGPQKGAPGKESPALMAVPMAVMAVIVTCGAFVSGFVMERFIKLSVHSGAGAHGVSLMPANTLLIVISAVVVILAVLHHSVFAAVKKDPALSVEHIRNAPGAKKLYDLAFKRTFDTYDIGGSLVRIFARTAFALDRAVDWMTDGFPVLVAEKCSVAVRKAHTGSYGLYIGWAVAGTIVVLFVCMR